MLLVYNFDTKPVLFWGEAQQREFAPKAKKHPVRRSFPQSGKLRGKRCF